MPKRTLTACLALLIGFLMVLSACSPTDEGKKSEDDAVAFELTVDHDSFFGIPADTVIGDVWFSDSVGMVGTPVRVVLQVDEQYYKKFKDYAVDGLIFLTNPDSVKDGDLEQDFIVDDNEVQFDLIIPQIKTVPSILDFDLTITTVNPDDDTQDFQASISYQFLVNKGTPAT